MAVKGLDAGEQLAVVADGDEDLDAVAHGGLEDGEGPRGELVLLELRDLVLTVVRLSAPCSPLFCVGVVTPASGDRGGEVCDEASCDEASRDEERDGRWVHT